MYKELERQNFIKWYCCYATKDEIEKVKRANRNKLERLIDEYDDEIEKINRTERLREFVIRSVGEKSELVPVNSV